MRGRIAVLIVGCLVVACSDDQAPSRAADPKLLSSRGLYADLARRELVDGAFEYEPAYPLWSDGADKRRWLVLPAGERVDTSDLAHWRFPLGTKLFKEFRLEGEPLETRLIERIKQTGRIKEDFFMGTFVWRDDHSDAVLDADGEDNVNGTDHDVPAQKFCIVCHRGEPGAVLGFSALQLSASGALQKAERRKLLSENPAKSFTIPGDEIERAALGSLHANCGHCHSETGVADFMHLRILPEECELPVQELDAYRSSVDAELSDEWEDQPAEFERRIVPGEPDQSAIVYRMEQRGDDELVPDQMPPLATRKVDDAAVAAVRAWIASLPPTAARRPDAEAGPMAPTGAKPAPPNGDSSSPSLPEMTARGSGADLGAAGSGQPPVATGPMQPDGGVDAWLDAGLAQPDAKVSGETDDDAGSADDDAGVDVETPGAGEEGPPG